MKTAIRNSRPYAALQSLQHSFPILLPILYFLTMCLAHQSTSRPTLMVLMGLVLVLGALRFGYLRSRMGLPLIALSLVVVLGGISTSYAVSGKFALEDFLNMAVAFCAAVLLLLLFPGEGTAPGRRIAGVLEGAAALASLFSIDLISTRFLSGLLHSLFSLLGSSFMDLTGAEPGVRMISIFGNANIFAGCAGIGVLLSLSLVLSSDTRRERRAHLCCLYINSTAFLLAFSMGATASIAVAFLAFLLLEHKDRRAGLFALMLATLVLAGAGVAVCSMTALDAWDGIQPVPLLCLAVGSVLMCLIHERLVLPLAGRLQGKGKLLVILTCAILAALIAFALTAYNLTGPIQLAQGESVTRAAYPDPGAYTLSASGGGDIQVTVRSQNRHETMMHTHTVLYSGALDQAAFTVPEDSLVVYFDLQAQQPTRLEQLSYTGDAGEGRVPLDYPLLPGFIANRLQGLFANQNAIQRMVFFEDGLKIFQMRPVLGLGMGAYMTVIQSVQDFHYETRYVHNHYIQTLFETGLVGCALFVALLVLSAVCLLKARKKDGFHPLVPALGAALVFMSIHAGVEIVFSVYCYLPMACGVFVLINLCCAGTLPQPGKRVSAALCLVLAALMLVFFFFLDRNMTARRMVEREYTFATLDRAASIDPFEWKDYAINYMINSTREDLSEEIRQRGAYYAQKLDCGISNSVYLHLTQYYLSIGQVEQAMHMARIHAGYIASSSEEWNTLLLTLAAFGETTEEFVGGVLQLVDMMNTWNEEHLGTIQLDEYAQAFVDWALAQ